MMNVLLTIIEHQVFKVVTTLFNHLQKGHIQKGISIMTNYLNAKIVNGILMG